MIGSHADDDPVLDDDGATSCSRSDRNMDLDQDVSLTHCKTSGEDSAPHASIPKTRANYQCTVCDKTFAQKDHFTRHSRIHNGERPFQCHICDKTFNKKSGLMRHLTIHKTGRPFKCNICDKMFKVQRYLTNHSLLHNDELNVMLIEKVLLTSVI